MAKKHSYHAKYNRYGVFDVCLIIFMVLFMACIVGPFMHMIAISLSDNKYVILNEVSFWPKGFTFHTYIEMFENGGFMKAYGVTIFVTVVGTIIALAITSTCAYALSRRAIVGHTFFSLCITFTLFFGGGLIPNYLNLMNLGLTNTVWALIIPSALNTWWMIIMRSFFINYPREILESGQLDGLQESGVFFRLVLPTSKASLATIGLYYAVAYWNNYMNSRMYISSAELYPVMHYLQQLTSEVQQSFIEEHNVLAAPVRYSAIIIVILPIMCVYPFIQKYFVKGVMVGSVKG